MQNRRLKLRGAIGIQLGLGLDEIEIDFTKMRAGLIAISGDNGKGKTTIIENLQPFRSLVSRDGNLADHFYLKDSYRIVEYEYKNQIYESFLQIDGETKKQKAYLYLFTEAGKKPLNDGNVSTYDIAIEKLVGSEKLFFNSNFCGQKSKGIAGLDASDRRDLFSEILGMECYADYCEFAKKELKKADIDLAGINGQLSLLNKEINALKIEDSTQLQIHKENLALTIESYVTNIDKLEARKLELEKQISVLEERSKSFEVGRNRVIEIDTEIAELYSQYNIDKLALTGERDQEISAFEEQGDISFLIKEKDRLEVELSGLATKFENERNTIIEELLALEFDNKQVKDSLKVCSELIKEREKIEANAERRNQVKVDAQEIQTKLSELSVKESTLMNNFREEIVDVEAGYNLNKTEQEIDKQKVELTHTEEKRDRLVAEFNTRLESMKREAGTIDAVPCSETVGQGCQFLIRAYETQKEIPVIEQKHQWDIEGVESEIETLQSSITLKENMLIISMSAKDRKVKEITDKYSVELGKLKACKDKSEIISKSLAIESQQLIDAEIKKIQLDKALQDTSINEQKVISFKNLYDEKNKNLNNIDDRKIATQKVLSSNIENVKMQLFNNDNIKSTKIESIQNNYIAKLEALKSKNAIKKASLTKEKEAIKLADDGKIEAEIKDTVKALIDVKAVTTKELQDKKNLEAQLMELNIQLDNTLKSITRKAEIILSIEKLNIEKARYEQDVREWAYLVESFDRTGIPILKLENSGHEITLKANDLLSIFDSPFRIAIDTTRPTKDGKKHKEVFEISVIDDRGVTKLENKSGGQQVWIETALSLAISLFLHDSDKSIDTAFLDEKDGAFDPKNAFSYRDMIEKAHEKLGVHHTMIITHRPELLQLIPNKIVLSDNAVKIYSEN
jgi:exonuclease SbcC